MINTIDFDSAPSVLSTELTEGRRLFASASTVAVVIEIKPGGEVPEHTTEEDVFFMVLQGSVLLTINGESVSAAPQSLAECPGGISKGMKNTGEENARVLVVKMS